MNFSEGTQGGNGRRRIHYAGLADWMRKGTASDFIKPFHVRPGQRFVLLCRVSSCQQGKRGNLRGQRRQLTREVEKRGGIVVGEVCYEWGGKGAQWFDKLRDAARLARQQDATLLAATPDRFFRSTWFRPDHPVLCQAQAQLHDLHDLQSATLGVPLMTRVHPDATAAECKSLMTRWGQEAKGKKGGRPPKGRYGHLAAWRERARVLHGRHPGWGCRKLAKEVSHEAGFRVSHTTVHRWISSQVGV